MNFTIFDYKEEYKKFYLPPKQPDIVGMSKVSFLAVRGEDDPSEENGEYKRAVELFYDIARTIKMNCRGEHIIEGLFEYIIPPLEEPWWQEGIRDASYSRKGLFQWISLIRPPDLVRESDFEWALKKAAKKEKMDFSQMEFFPYDEGLCIQCIHLGSYNNKPAAARQTGTYT